MEYRGTRSVIHPPSLDVCPFHLLLVVGRDRLDRRTRVDIRIGSGHCAAHLHYSRVKENGDTALLALGTSQAYVDYTTSGLENPLSHLLFAFFVLQYARLRDTLCYEFVLSLIAALALLNRMDTILLYLPALYSVFIIRRDRLRWRFVLLGFTPFAAWEIFSLAYYGFPFPNTAYAKLQTNIPLP